MSTFVLCHGAWGGSYGFRKVRPLIWGAGHEVFTPSLTGIGERSHLAGPRVDLATHIQDLTNVILYEDLTDLVLLGFSYGGMVVAGALDDIGDRVQHLVFLDALVPVDGQSAMELLSAPGPEPAPASLPPPQWQVAPLPRQLDSPEETAWSDARRSPQPIRTLTQPVSMLKPLEHWPFALTFIKATAEAGEKPDSAFWQAAHRAKASGRWNYHEVETGHMVPLNQPEALAEILLGPA